MKLINLIYPIKCVACGEYIKEGYLCAACSKKLEYVSAHEDFKLKEHAYNDLAVPLYYSGVARSAMLRLKFTYDISSAKFFAERLEMEVRSKFYGVKFDTFTCVPMTKKSQAKRGYNQSALIASNMHIDAFYDFDLLKKASGTKVQHELTAAERKKNVINAYTLSSGRDVRGQTILLIDDILTTGSTCDECVRALRFSGASAVYVACATLTKSKIIV